MKKITAILLLSMLLNSCIGAGENSEISANQKDYFPNLVGIDLQGNRREVPKSFSNKINLVAVAFKREQQENVNGWIKVADEIMAKNPEVSFFELPVIYQLNPISRSFINNGMRRGVIEERARSRTITLYTNREEFFKVMEMAEDKIYLLVISDKGKVMQKIEGDATAQNVKSLKEKWYF